MASGNTMVPTTSGPAPRRTDRKNKTTTSKPAGKQKIQAGGSGKMHKFAGATPQQPGVTATSTSSGKGAPFAKGGPSGKMQKFTPVKPQKPGVSAVTNSGGGSYAKK